MKKYLAIISIILLASGCTKEEVLPVESPVSICECTMWQYRINSNGSETLENGYPQVNEVPCDDIEVFYKDTVISYTHTPTQTINGITYYGTPETINKRNITDCN